jgi:hypothetical protein
MEKKSRCTLHIDLKVMAKFHRTIEVDVGNGCVGTIDCDAVDGWDRGQVKPLAWESRNIPNLGRAWVLIANILTAQRTKAALETNHRSGERSLLSLRKT